jgi:hypothetical protein
MIACRGRLTIIEGHLDIPAKFILKKYVCMADDNGWGRQTILLVRFLVFGLERKASVKV